MKLFLSALFLAAVPAALAQQPAPPASAVQQQNAVQSQGLQPAVVVNDLVAHSASPENQAACPLYLESASVAPSAGYLPVDAQAKGDGALELRFRNQSGKRIVSAAITAHLNVKTDIYALDAHPLELHLAFARVTDENKALDQLTRIALPEHVYLFGVVRVTLDQVTFTDGSVWTASPTHNSCATSGPGNELVESK